MLSQVKYRFLGAVVLIGLVLILVPMLFDNVIRYQTVRPLPVPELPKMTVAAEPQQPVIMTPAAAKVNKNISPAKAYTIQVASFKETATINNLVALLQKDGFTAYSHQSGKTGFTTVFVGPVLTKEQADTLVAQLSKKYSVKPVLVAYAPNAVEF